MTSIRRLLIGSFIAVSLVLVTGLGIAQQDNGTGGFGTAPRPINTILYTGNGTYNPSPGAITTRVLLGGGGGGGYGNSSGGAGAGGPGTQCGGGGGGGSALNGSTAGAGGLGGNGFALVIESF